jgi:hypothetical protein
MAYVEYEDRGQGADRPGVFISRDALVSIGIGVVAVGVAVLVAFAPAVGVPLGVGAAVAGLLFSVWTWCQRPSRDRTGR